jgi:aryl-alcohol dehydrogenase-like predicted oxidoreductase
MKRVGEFAVAVALQPIIVAKARANLLDRRAHRLLQVCEREVDGVTPNCALNRGKGF